MPDMKFPRYIFAIGGAGKNLIYTTLDKEWILKEILRPQFSATTVDVIIIDTAIEEENRDLEKIEDIKNNIRRIEEDYRNTSVGTNKNIGRINIFYRLLTKEMTLQSPYDLIGIGDKVKDATGADVWWVNDPKILGEDWHKKIINRENFKELNFAKGVYRKRAIGKAIYYKAVSEGKFDIDLIQTAQVDILLGLGGGTGSGMAFDLAEKLKKIQPTANITLFGVLSTLDESSDEKTNSFAMISEIEHGYLNGNTPFKEVILIPMEITRYPGREKASDEHERLLREFDETVPYILVSYHNNPAQRIFENLPDYAPFIIATSQLVRYNVESIRRLKEKLIEALNDKEKSLKDEEEIYNNIRKFVVDFYPEGIESKVSILPEEDKSFIRERLSKFNIVLEHQFFKELNYNSVIHLKKAVDAGLAGIEPNDIEKQISSIKSETDTITIGSEGYREDTDASLYKILKKDIEAIDMLKDSLVSIGKIQDNIVKDTLKVIVKMDEFSLGRQLNKIREEVDVLNGKKKQLEGNLKFLEEDTKNYEEKIKRDLDNYDKDWRKNEANNIQSLDSIDDSVIKLNNNLTALKGELTEYIDRTNSRNAKNIDAEPFRNIETITDKIYQELENIGIYYEDKILIMKNVSGLKELRKAQIIVKKGVPIFDKVLKITGIKTKRTKDVVESKNKVLRKKAELNSDKVFEVRDNAISCVYEYNVEKKVDEKKEDIINKIVGRTKDNYPDAVPVLFSTLKNALQNNRGDINIDEIIKSHLGYEMNIDKRKGELKDKRVETTQVIDNINKYKTFETTILRNIKDGLGRHSKYIKNYHDSITNIEKDVKAMRRAEKDTIRYIMEMQPENIYRATVAGANINNILEDQNEVLILKQNLKDGIERSIDTRYNVMVMRVIENAAHTKRWKKSKIMNSFVTIANITPDSIGADVIGSFSAEKENYSEWKCSWGDPWGVGIVLFIAGVPVDNIRNVSDSRAGYYRYYKNIEQNGVIFFHHSYMLEKGKFIKRKKILNLENETDKELLLGDNKEVKSTLMQNYDEIEIKNCLSTTPP